MKKIALKESKVLLEVRRIKEEIAREAASDPGYYQRLNGLGAKLLAPYPKKAKKRFAVKPAKFTSPLRFTCSIFSERNDLKYQAGYSSS